MSLDRASAHFKTSAVLELILASALWGFGFIATAWALRELTPLTLIGFRMSFAFVLGIVLCLASPSLRPQLSWDQFWLSFWPGLFLSATMVLQTWALRYTTVTKCGFITTLYVLMVPLLESWMLRRKIPKYHMIYVFIALVGVALICDLPQIFRGVTEPGVDPKTIWNIGDWITLACAVAASLQIVWFGKIQGQIRSSFVFNVYQTFWTGLLPFGLMFFVEQVPTKLSLFPFLGMLELVIGSTMIAFSLQVRAQKQLSPSVSSLVFLLESPFAAIFGFLILGETPSLLTMAGAVIILAALIASVVFSKEGTDAV